MFALSLLTVFTCLATFGQSFAKSETEDLAARSVPSPGGACYFKCPSPLSNGRVNTGLQNLQDYYGTRYTNCIYDNSDNYICQYYTGTGQKINGMSVCPNQLSTSECRTTAQGNPNANNYFKRTIGTREQSPAEKRLAALQYKPEKKASKTTQLKQRRKARKLD